MVAAGAGLGVLYTLCIAVISEHHRPDPAFGMKLTFEALGGGGGRTGRLRGPGPPGRG